jgi:hypothetical protein
MKTIVLILFFCLFLMSCSTRKDVYLFTSFHEPANEGLRLLWSNDAYQWNDLNHIYLKPEVGAAKIMRDPSMILGPDDSFHLVWTSAWKGNEGFGYASSKDGVQWSDEKIVPIMQAEPTTVNVWAPELFYDKDSSRYIIIWASTIPFRFEKGIEEENNNHRMYYTTTKDFSTFTPAKLFLDPKFSVIDAQIIRRADKDYVLILKDNTRPNRNIKVAFANNPLGPWKDISQPFTTQLTEGPNLAKVRDGWLIYYDNYGMKKFGAAFTTDFKTFTDASNKIKVPEGHKHGTILMITKRQLKALKNAASSSATNANL